MPVKKLENIKVGSIVCDKDEPKHIYKIIEKRTVFDGFDCVGDYSYGVSKTIARMKKLSDKKVYRFPIDKKFILVQEPSGLTYAAGLRKAGMPVGVYYM